MNDDAHLISLLLDWEERRDRGEPATPEELCADHPELLEPLRRAVRAVERFDDDFTTPTPESTDAGTDGEESGTGVGSESERIDRYRIIRFLAKGGLGEVHVASDVELGRRVALKRINRDRRRDPVARRRFLREAMLTASLEHPGIVPVHGLVRDADGHFFYAMRLIEGESLHDAVLRLRREPNPKPHGEEPGDGPRPTAWTPRDLLRRFVAACDAVAYAHSRDIVHRDLKPANIMLGPFGETYVVDWGLATLIGRADADPASPSSDHESGSPLAPTLALGVVGTPAFMAPEQASDPCGAVAPAADVYSLGATLHMILVGEAPKPARRGTREASNHADDPPPRSVPPALWAVRGKAMALNPKDRYAGAKELAEDVSRWLDGEVVSAYPEPWPDRLARWTLRHRTAVVAAGCAAAVAVVAWFVLASNEIAARGATAANSMTALNATADFADRNLRRLNAYGLDWVRRDFVRSFESLGKLLDDAPEGNRDLDYERARGMVLLAQLQLRPGSDASASRAAVERAEPLVDRLIERQGRTPRLLALLSRIDLLRNRLESAVARDRELLGTNPADPDLRVDARVRIALCLRDLSLDIKARDEALALLDQARAQAELALAERPESVEAARARALVLGYRYAVDADRAARGAAVEAHRKWIALAKNDIEAVNSLAEIGVKYGDITSDPEFVVASARVREDFAEGNEAVRSSLTQIVRAQSAAGDALMRAGRLDEARAAFRRSIQVAKVLKFAPDDWSGRQAYFLTLCKLAGASSSREAAPLLEEALGAYEGLADRRAFPESITGSAEVSFNLAELLFQSGSTAARSAYERCLGHAEEALDFLPRDDPNRTWVEEYRRRATEKLRRVGELPGLAARLPAVVAGRETPKDSWEVELFATMAFAKNLPAASARIWDAAFRADPSLVANVEEQRRLHAAIAAVEAGCGEFDGAALPPEDRAALRRRALSWMEEELEAWRRVRVSGTADQRSLIGVTMLGWRIGADLGRVRDPKDLNALPESERAAWRDFWARVAYLGDAIAADLRLPEDVFAR